MVFPTRLPVEKIPAELFSRLKAIFRPLVYSVVEAGFCIGNRQICLGFGHKKARRGVHDGCDIRFYLTWTLRV